MSIFHYYVTILREIIKGLFSMAESVLLELTIMQGLFSTAFSPLAERVKLKLAANSTVSVRRAENRKIKDLKIISFVLL